MSNKKKGTSGEAPISTTNYGITPGAKKKYRFSIYRNGRKVGESWAVSADKATANYWWKECKGCDRFAYTDYKPSDFVARID